MRRYEKAHAGELVHIDVKKVAKVPPGGGWRVHGRGSAAARRNNKRRKRLGYTYLHVAVDDHSRLAYVEAHDNQNAQTAAAFYRRCRDWFDRLNVAVVAVVAVMTDNAKNFTSTAFADALAERHVTHRRTRPYRPQTNGKVRTAQPHPRRRIPLQLQIPLRTRPPTPAPDLGAHLQSPPAPHRHRRTTRQPRQQPLWALELAAAPVPIFQGEPDYSRKSLTTATMARNIIVTVKNASFL